MYTGGHIGGLTKKLGRAYPRIFRGTQVSSRTRVYAMRCPHCDQSLLPSDSEWEPVDQPFSIGDLLVLYKRRRAEWCTDDCTNGEHRGHPTEKAVGGDG